MSRFLALAARSGARGLHAAPAPRAPPAPVGAEVDIVRQGDVWTADFRFGRPAPIWVFVRSSVTRAGELAWRAQTWTVETPGVRLERRGRYDVLVAENGGPVPAAGAAALHARSPRTCSPIRPRRCASPTAPPPCSAASSTCSACRTRPPPRSCRSISAPPTSPSPAPARRFRDAAGRCSTRAGASLRSASTTRTAPTSCSGRPTPVVGAGIAAIYDPALPPWIRDHAGRSDPGDPRPPRGRARPAAGRPADADGELGRADPAPGRA